MKKALLFLCLLFCLFFLVIVGWPTRTLVFFDIPVLTDSEIDDLIVQRSPAAKRLSFPFAVHGETLPNDRDAQTWYSPALNDAITLDLPQPWRIARTETTTDPTDGDTCRILIYNDVHYREYTLIETGLPVTAVTLRRFDLDVEYIQSTPIPAAARILSVKDDGTLAWDNYRVEIKTRGMSSRNYAKKSYTLFFRSGEDGNALHTPLGLPADTKFALNSLYEDESKIRESLAYHIAAMLDPNNALQFTYTELLLDNQYYGLYGMHQIITEHALQAGKDDVIYKINSYIMQDVTEYEGVLPAYELSYGTDPDAIQLQRFLSPFIGPIEAFPAFYDRENFVNHALLMEIIAGTDSALKNMVITHQAAQDQFRITGWDMDLSFGNIWDASADRMVIASDSILSYRILLTTKGWINPLGILYHTCPDFAEEVDARYRELRKSTLTDSNLLSEAAARYDLLSACGARQRDAERWPGSATSTDNSFIEAFIPARMAFLDEAFAYID